jgi:hypothetical protein
MPNPDDTLRTRAARRADAKLGFLIHLPIYLAVVGGMAVQELLTRPDNLTFQWTAIGWGVGVLIHGLLAFARLDDVRERMIQSELRRGGL